MKQSRIAGQGVQEAPAPVRKALDVENDNLGSETLHHGGCLVSVSGESDHQGVRPRNVAHQLFIGRDDKDLYPALAKPPIVEAIVTGTLAELTRVTDVRVHLRHEEASCRTHSIYDAAPACFPDLTFFG